MRLLQTTILGGVSLALTIMGWSVAGAEPASTPSAKTPTVQETPATLQFVEATPLAESRPAESHPAESQGTIRLVPSKPALPAWKAVPAEQPVAAPAARTKTTSTKKTTSAPAGDAVISFRTANARPQLQLSKPAEKKQARVEVTAANPVAAKPVTPVGSANATLQLRPSYPVTAAAPIRLPKVEVSLGEPEPQGPHATLPTQGDGQLTLVSYQDDEEDDLLDDEGEFEDAEDLDDSSLTPPTSEPQATTPAQPPLAQPPLPQPQRALAPAQVPPRPLAYSNTQAAPFEVLGSTAELTVTRRRNKILRSRDDIYRVAVVDPSICDVVQFTPREVSIIGRGQGATNVTFWFANGEHQPVTYLVRVVPDPEIQVERERQFQILEEIIAELFPDSKVHLMPVADKLIVKGQAKGAEEAAQIMAVIRGEAISGGDSGGRGYGGIVDGVAANPLSGDATGTSPPASNVINMLRIPGVQQVALKVKIAELNRSAAREFGVDLDLNFDTGDGNVIIQTLLNAATSGTTGISGTFNSDKIDFGIHYLQSRGVIRILSEPTLVTLSGRPASFLAGGEFAVPTVVGVGGASAVTTDFRSFGVILNFLPTVIDKDR